MKIGTVLQCGGVIRAGSTGGGRVKERIGEGKGHGLRVGCNRSRDCIEATMRWHTSWASGGLERWLPNRTESVERVGKRRILTIQKSFGSLQGECSTRVTSFVDLILPPNMYMNC